MSFNHLVRLGLTLSSFLFLNFALGNHAPIRRAINILPEGVELSAGCKECRSSITFASKEAKNFEVGTDIPTLPFKTKQSWAGDIPIPDTPTSKNASLFFWFWAQDAKVSGEDLVIWFNGGPSCSSIIYGLATENGPFLIEGDLKPTRINPYSWTIAANILYINFPTGVAFTKGRVRNKNEFQISEEFVLWLGNFYKIFPELLEKNLWITGESYAGTYVPFQIDQFFRNPPNGNASMYKGGMLIDPTISDTTVQFDIPSYDFIEKHQRELLFTKEDVAMIKNISDECHYTNFTEKYVHYPPKGALPSYNESCNILSQYVMTATKKNEGFNVYNVAQPDLFPNASEPLDDFFNNPEVQSYINAPVRLTRGCNQAFDWWGDRTQPPDRIPNYKDSYFAQMIERSSKFIIMQGLLDGIILSNGSRIALQNLTWNGRQGFQRAPHRHLYDLDGYVAGLATDDERGLTYVEVANSGHMIPEDQPSFALSALLHLLGKHDWTKK